MVYIYIGFRICWGVPVKSTMVLLGLPPILENTKCHGNKTL